MSLPLEAKTFCKRIFDWAKSCQIVKTWRNLHTTEYSHSWYTCLKTSDKQPEQPTNPNAVWNGRSYVAPFSHKTVLSNILLQDSSPTPFVQHSSPTLVSKTSVHRFATTLFSTSTTLFSDTSLQSFATTLFSTTLFSPALFSNTSLQGSLSRLLYNTLLQLISTTLFSNCSLQHSSPTISPRLLYNTLLQHIPTTSSPTLLYNSSTECSSTTLLYSLRQQTFKTQPHRRKNTATIKHTTTPPQPK